MRPALYLIMDGLDLNRPQNSGYLPVTPDGSTGAITRKLVQQNKVKNTIFYTKKNCDDSLKLKILESFHTGYVEGVANVNVCFTQNKTIKLLNHLYDSNGTITPSEMEYATNDMITPYDPSNTTTKLFFQIGKGLKIYDAEKNPFKNAQIIAKAYLLV